MVQDKIVKNLKKTNPELLKKIECISNNKKVPKAEELKKSKGDRDAVSMVQVDYKIPLTKVKSDSGCPDHARSKEVFKGPYPIEANDRFGKIVEYGISIPFPDICYPYMRSFQGICFVLCCRLQKYTWDCIHWNIRSLCNKKNEHQYQESYKRKMGVGINK